MSEAMSSAVPEMAGPVQAATHTDPVLPKAVFSYCCECGTYDAHTTNCTCCGFDFCAEAPTEQA